jgi:hypothetical protein
MIGAGDVLVAVRRYLGGVDRSRRCRAMKHQRADDMKNPEDHDDCRYQSGFQRDRRLHFRTRIFTNEHPVNFQSQIVPAEDCPAFSPAPVDRNAKQIASWREESSRADPCYDVNIGELPGRRLIRTDDALRPGRMRSSGDDCA